MRPSRSAVTVAVLLAACGPSDPWPGSYEGTTEARGVTCDLSETADHVTDSVVSIDRDRDGTLILNEACLVRLEELSDQSARVRPVSCESALNDGTPATIAFTGGSLALDGDELSARYTMHVETATVCLDVTATFVGIRVP